MTRKRIRPFVWGAFLVAGILASIFHSCSRAKAEGWDPGSGDPWQPPDWAESTFEPVEYTAPPVPTPQPNFTEVPSKDPTQWRGSSTQPPSSEQTPEPGEQGLDMAIPQNAFVFKTYYNTGIYNVYSDAPGVRLVSHLSGVDTQAYTITANRPWILTTASNSYYSGAPTLSSNTSLPNTSYTQTTLGCRTHGMFFGLCLVPSHPELLTNDMVLKVNLFQYCSLQLHVPTNANDLAIYEAVGPDESAFIDLPVYVYTTYSTSSGNVFRDTYTTTLSYLFLSNVFTFNLNVLEDGETLSAISIDLVYNWMPIDNPVYKQFVDYYSSNNITPSYFPTYDFSFLSNTSIVVKISQDNSLSANSLTRLLKSIFVPDQARLSAIINASLPDPASGGGSFVLSIRNTLYDLFSTQQRSAATITLPSIDIPMGESSIHVFDGYTFDLRTFYYGDDSPQGERPPFATLMTGVRFMTSTFIFSAFFGSLWEIFIEVFGLNKWSGVYDREESKIEEASL